MITIDEIREKLKDRYEPEELILLLGITIDDLVLEFEEKIYLNLSELDIYYDPDNWRND